MVGTGMRRVSATIAAFALLLVLSTSAGAGGGELSGADVTIYYGPLCNHRPGEVATCKNYPVPGVRVTLATYSNLKPLDAKLSNSHGVAAFPQRLPFGLAILFDDHVNDHAFDAGWRMKMLPTANGKTVHIDVLLCASDDWVAALGHVPSSCADRTDALADGTHGTS